MQRNLVKNMPVEVPHFLLPDDIMMCEDTGELYLHRDTQLDDDSLQPERVFGRVAIMRASVLDEETDTLLSGYVVDLRYIENADEFSDAADAEAPDDQEDRNQWEKRKRAEVPIAALAVWGIDREESIVVGDQRFGAAALHLAQLADERDALIAKRAATGRKYKDIAKKVQAKQAAADVMLSDTVLNANNPRE